MATENHCENCRIILLDQQELEDHQALVHWKCPKCSTQCNSLQALLSHQVFNHVDEKWLKECSHCDFISNPSSVLAHELESHVETNDKNDKSFEEGNLVIDEQDPLAIDDQDEENKENIPPENTENDFSIAKHILPDVPMNEPKTILPNILAKKTLPNTVTPIAVVSPAIASTPVMAVTPETKSLPEDLDANFDKPEISEDQNSDKVCEPEPMDTDLPSDVAYE